MGGGGQKKIQGHFWKMPVKLFSSELLPVLSLEDEADLIRGRFPSP